jgi:outer membrane protein OmpA-like peptidoglycan-associated protein
MAVRKTYLAVIGTALMLGGCSFSSEALWPTLAGEEETTQENVVEAQPVGANATTQYDVAASTAPLSGVSQTGTFVGSKVENMQQELNRLKAALNQHNNELQQLRAQTVSHSQAYHGTVAAISARLQVGTTPGNPVLVQQWNNAQGELDRVNDDIAALNSLANKVAADSTLSTFLLESVRSAYQVSGAVDEDHRQLALLEDETNRTTVLIDRLLNEISESLARQTSYVSTERANLNALALAVKNGEIFGDSLSKRVFQSQAAPASASPRMAATSDRPLVVIRFDTASVKYEQALYNAVNRVLERRPQASFDVVAVTPNRGTPAQVALNANKSKRNAQAVLRSLTDMGMPSTRVRASDSTSASVSSNEVHVFVR